MLDVTPVLGILGGLVAFVTAFFALRRFYNWLRPIRIAPRIKVVFDGSGPDQILARVTNISREDQVLVRCMARSTYPIRAILYHHLRRPLTPPRLYPNIWYAGIGFNLIGASPVRLTPFQRQELHYSLSNHPLCLFLSPMIQIQAELSTGRVFRSGRLEIPEKWRLMPWRPGAGAKTRNA
jgi:hypothetical protein